VSLDLAFRQAEVEVPFSPQLTFIHGQTGAGKSSITRIVDWCLGGNMDFTHALEDELVSAALFVEIGAHAVRISRDREDKSHVRLSWLADGDEPHNEVVPIQSQGGDWDPSEPETLSDHLFVLAGTTPLRVPQSRKRDDSNLQRLSFRDFLAFCYLPQEMLDVALFRFGDNVKARKSEDVMRALLGLFSERQQELQAESDALLRQSNSLKIQANEVTEFLDRLEIDDLAAVEENLRQASESLADLEERSRAQSDAALPPTHPQDDARRRSAELEQELIMQREGLSDIVESLERDRRLRAELITAQLKVERSNVAVEILSGVQFGHCPQCGNTVGPSNDPETCKLCHQGLGGTTSILPPDAAETDLQSRIDELATSIERHQVAQRKERRRLRELEARKAEEDDALVELLREGESKRIAAVRENARQVAVARNAVARYETASRLRSEVSRLLEESKRLTVERAPVIEQLKAENAALEEREQTRSLIAGAFKEALLAVRMPDIRAEDNVVIPDDLQPRLEPASGGSSYGFKNLGSSGMKTLFQCCYALALHRVAAEENLLLPGFLIIDTPTQNIDEQVDGEIFHGFFRYLYGLMEGSMNGVQVVLVDSEIEPPPESIELVDRKMLRNDPRYPRLVPYGPAGDSSEWDSEN
jgi:AAA domain